VTAIRHGRGVEALRGLWGTIDPDAFKRPAKPWDGVPAYAGHLDTQLDCIVAAALHHDNAAALQVVQERLGTLPARLPGLAFAISPGRPRCAAFLWSSVLQASIARLPARDAAALQSWLERSEVEQVASVSDVGSALAAGVGACAAAFAGRAGAIRALLRAHPTLYASAAPGLAAGWTLAGLAAAGGSGEAMIALLAQWGPASGASAPTTPAIWQLLRTAAVFGQADVWRVLTALPRFHDAAATAASTLEAAGVALAVVEHGPTHMLPLAIALPHFPPLRSAHWAKRPLTTAAAELGNLDALRWLIEVGGMDPNAAGSGADANPLMTAVRHRRVHAVRYLTTLPACGLEVVVARSDPAAGHATPLDEAVGVGALAIVDALLTWPGTGTSRPAARSDESTHLLLLAAKPHYTDVLFRLTQWERLHTDPRFALGVDAMSRLLGEVMTAVSFPEDNSMAAGLVAIMTPTLFPYLQPWHMGPVERLTNLDVVRALVDVGYNFATCRLNGPRGAGDPDREYGITLARLWLPTQSNYLTLAAAGLRVDMELVGHPSGVRFLPDLLLRDVDPHAAFQTNMSTGLLSRTKALMTGWWDPTAATRDAYLASLRRLLTVSLNPTGSRARAPSSGGFQPPYRPLWSWLSLGTGGMAAAAYIVTQNARPPPASDSTLPWLLTPLSYGRGGAAFDPLPYTRIVCDDVDTAAMAAAAAAAAAQVRWPPAFGWQRRRPAVVAAVMMDEGVVGW
jgi:hypothetical protein